jgi:hypothetical protein
LGDSVGKFEGEGLENRSVKRYQQGSDGVKQFSIDHFPGFIGVEKGGEPLCALRLRVLCVKSLIL